MKISIEAMIVAFLVVLSSIAIPIVFSQYDSENNIAATDRQILLESNGFSQIMENSNDVCYYDLRFDGSKSSLHYDTLVSDIIDCPEEYDRITTVEFSADSDGNASIVFADGLYPERIDIGYEIISQSGTISDLAMEIDGHWFLFTDAFSPKELCWVWFISLASEALLLAAVAIVMATIVVIVLENGDTIALDFPDWGFGTTSSSAIVNDISGRYKDGKLVGFTICGSTYSLKSEYEDVSDRLNGKHYFAFLSGPTVYVFPREIGLDNARNVMLLDPNYNGKYSTYTVSQDDAYNAAYTHWGLPIQDSNRPTGSNGIYYMHYHTHDHATSGHSFYGQPLFDEPYPHV